MTRRSLAIVCAILIVAAACGRRRSTAEPAATKTTTVPVQTTTKAVSRQAHVSTDYSLQWLSNNAPTTMQHGDSVPVQITVRNTGDWPWPDPKTANPADPTGAYAVRVGYSWHKDVHDKTDPEPARGDLTSSVPAGATATFTINITAPQRPGDYLLEFDLVEELVAWFSSHGAKKLTIPVKVL